LAISIMHIVPNVVWKPVRPRCRANYVVHRGAADRGGLAELGGEAVGRRVVVQDEVLGPGGEHDAGAGGKVGAWDGQAAAAIELDGVAGRRDEAGQLDAGADEAGDEAAGGRVVDDRGLADLLDLAGAHYRHAVGHAHRLVLVVGDHDRGQVEAALQPADLELQVQAQRAVEGGERLVEQQHRRFGDDGARERDPLLLSARERARQTVGKVRHLHRLERGLHPRYDLGPGGAPGAQPVGDVLGDRHVREERIVLEHHADPAVTRRQMVHRLPIEQDTSGARPEKPGDGAEQRGLAAAGGAEQGDEFARLYCEVDAVDHRRPAIGKADPGDVHAVSAPCVVTGDGSHPRLEASDMPVGVGAEYPPRTRSLP